MDFMLILFFILAFLISWIVTFYIRKWAIAKRMLDKPNERSSHKRITPLGGGVAIVVSWYVCVVLMAIFYPEMMPVKLFAALLPGILLALVGIRDDVKQLSPWIRLSVQLISVGLSLYILGGVNEIDFGTFTWQCPVVINLLVFLLLVWFVNLFNFYDGIDGNLGSEAIAISLMSVMLVPNSPLILFVACVGGFLVWNWQKAKIFMGDAGSTFIGFVFGVFAVYFQDGPSNGSYLPIPLILWLLICIVAVFDTTFTLMRRIIYRENVLVPHKNQLFQRLVLSGFTHQKTVLLQQFMNVVVAVGVWFVFNNKEYMLPAVLGFVALFCVYAFWVERRYPFVRQCRSEKQSEPSD